MTNVSPMQAVARGLPLAAFVPFRIGVVRFRRGSLPRKACVAILKVAAHAFKGSLASRLSEVHPLDLPGVTFSADDSMVIDAIYWFGVQGYEGDVAAIWVALCQRACAIVEVGGNIGLFSVLGARATRAPYTVVEPVPIIAEILRANLARNGLPHVEVLQAAAIANDTAADVTLDIPQEQHGVPVGAHLCEGVEIDGRSTQRLITVTGQPFRHLIAGRDLVKIDAEGIEAMLLQSARDIILAERPTMLIEVLPTATNLATIVSSLAREAGYRIFIIPEWGTDPIRDVSPDKFTAALPARFNSKDIVLSTADLPAHTAKTRVTG